MFFRFNLEAIDAKRSRLRPEQSSREHIIRALTRSRFGSAPPTMTPVPSAEESATLAEEEADDVAAAAATRAFAASYAPVRSPASVSTCREKTDKSSQHRKANLKCTFMLLPNENKHNAQSPVSGTTVGSRWVF